MLTASVLYAGRERVRIRGDSRIYIGVRQGVEISDAIKHLEVSRVQVSIKAGSAVGGDRDLVSGVTEVREEAAARTRGRAYGPRGYGALGPNEARSENRI